VKSPLCVGHPSRAQPRVKRDAVVAETIPARSDRVEAAITKRTVGQSRWAPGDHVAQQLAPPRRLAAGSVGLAAAARAKPCVARCRKIGKEFQVLRACAS
jgi:hypothetical protein